MKFVDRLKFTAAGTSAATVTFGAAVAACRTLAQAITDGALVVGDTGVPFTVDDGVGNWETALFTVTSATVLTRTATLASSAGGTNPATFTGASLSVFNNAPASYLMAATASASVAGTPAVGSTLVASLPPGITGTLQWTRSTKDVPPVKTAISGAVANAVNSLAYTVQSADGGYVLGCDASNTVVASTGVAVPVPTVNVYPRKVLGLSMPFGDLVSGALTGNSSWRTARRFPQAFKRLRCYLFNLDATNSMAGAKASWSPSESLANGVKPTIGGVASDASWQRFLFGGQLTTTLPPTGTAGIPSVTVSDWLVTPSIATTDGNPYPIGYFTTLFTSGAQIGYSTPGSNFQSFLEGLPGMKHAFRVYTNGGDCVETPASFTSGTVTNNMVPMLIEVEYNSGARTFIACGDSTLQGTGNTGNAGAALMALAQLDAAVAPADACVLAQSGSTAVRQDLKLKNIVANNIPDMIYFQPFSVNDSSNYSGSSAATIARIDYWISWCATNGVNLILDTPLPINLAGSAAVTGTNLTALTNMSTYVLSKASTTVKVLDLTPLHSAQYSGVWSTTYGFDNYHPNPAGHQFRADRLVEAIKSFG